MAALFLTETDVRDLLDMEIAIEVIEEAFRQLATGGAVNVPRVRARGAGICLHNLSAAADYLGVVGWKAYTTTKSGARFLTGLYSAATGEPLALIEADYLGQLRTGAASGVATEHMARPDARVVGLFGAGSQARTQLKAVTTVRKIELVEVYSRDEERCRQFCELMSEWCNTRVIPSRVPDDVAAEKDIVICATSARTAGLRGKGSRGRHAPQRHRVEFFSTRRRSTWRPSSGPIRSSATSLEQCRLEAGDFVQALEEGAVDWSHMRELADVVSDRENGTQNSPERDALQIGWPGD
jgi:ornithine cyclodeaminase/alanine dehydrogenase-like protein (mu-crystallin family)